MWGSPQACTRAFQLRRRTPAIALAGRWFDREKLKARVVAGPQRGGSQAPSARRAPLPHGACCAAPRRRGKVEGAACPPQLLWLPQMWPHSQGPMSPWATASQRASAWANAAPLARVI